MRVAASCRYKAFSVAIQYSGSRPNSVGSAIDTILAHSEGATEADSAIIETPGAVSILWQPWSSQKADKNEKPHTNDGCCSMYSSSSGNVNDRRISISKSLPNTLICIKYSKLFRKSDVGILNVCGLENILGSSVNQRKVEWNNIFAAFWRQACIEVLSHKT